MTTPAVSLLDICKPKQWKTLSKEDMVGTEHRVFGANGPIGYVDTYTHKDETILIGCRGSCGSVHVMPPYSYANGNAMALGELDSTRVDIRYLFRYLEQRGFRDVTTGSSQPQIIQSSLQRVEVPLPPLDEQRRIAAILDKADALRRKCKRALDLLDSLSQLTFIEMFGRLEAHRSSRCCKPLGEIAELINGDRSSNYPSGSDIVSSGVLFLSTSNIASDGLDLRNANYITEEKFKALTRGKLAVRDIIITLRGSLGQSALFENAGDTGFINAQMMIVRAGNKIDPKYLLQVLQLDDMRSHLKRIGSGSAVPQLTAKQISEIQVPVPSVEMQALFVSRVEKIRTLRHKLVRSAQSVDDLFASLQHRAFSGQL